MAIEMNGLNKEILRLAVPSILANITVPFVGMVDIAVAGHLNGTPLTDTAACIGGIAIGSLLFDLLYWNFSFLRVSTGGLVAQSFGRCDFEECSAVFSRSLILSLLFSAVILALQLPFPKLAFLAVKTTPEVHDLALNYFYIRIWAAPATMSLMVFRGWFVGMQDSLSSMLVDLTVNLVNIVASIVLTLGIGNWSGFGYPGIAVGTVIAQYSGMVSSIIIVSLKYSHINFKFKQIDWVKMRGLMSMNSDLFVRSLCMTAIYIGYTTIAARYGDVFLSASSILMKILMLFSFFTDGFAYSGEALTGRFIGEKNVAFLKRTVKCVFVWSMAVAVLFMAIYSIGGNWMTEMMTSDRIVGGFCRKFLWWMLLMPPLGCAAFTWDGIYEGATATKEVRNAMLLSVIAFFAIFFAGLHIFGIPSEYMTAETEDSPAALISAMNLLMTAYFAHLLARTLYLTARYKATINVVK